MVEIVINDLLRVCVLKLMKLHSAAKRIDNKSSCYAYATIGRARLISTEDSPCPLFGLVDRVR